VRYHLQRVLTGEWLSRDFSDLTEGTRSRTLSGPDSVVGIVAPELRFRMHTDGLRLLEPWATAIYAEDDAGSLVGGIIEKLRYVGEGRIEVDAPGWCRYPHGVPYMRATNFGAQYDPMNGVRHIWDHVQSFSNGALGMQVDLTTSSRRIGTNAEPYALVWWENTDCGGEIDNLAQQTPFDYAEKHTWANAAKTAVNHRLVLGYPRLGRQRTDMQFVEGTNVTAAFGPDEDGAEFTNDVIGIGKGEGAAMVWTNSAVVDGRLRRPRIVTDKTANLERISNIVARTLRNRARVDDIAEVPIIDHPTARIAAINPGDDIPLTIADPSFGQTVRWLRVLSITESDDGHTATLATQRSAAFTYSATEENT
jgi:hypothetical protein